MIKVNNVNKYYNKNKESEIRVINNTSLELPKSGLIALLGKSGSGKTTLLNVIGGLDKFDSGNIEIDGNMITKYQPKVIDAIRSNKIGYIFQNYYLINDKSVYDNLELSLKLAGLTDKEEIDKRIDYALNLVGLSNYKKRTPSTLSGGQQQRVGIARAIVKGSSIIIADEPTGNLDSDNAFAIIDILKSISKNCLVVLVTHEESIADFFADRIIRIKDGAIVEDYINESQNDLMFSESKKLFIKDFKHNFDVISENITIKYIGDNKSPINLTLIEKEGRLYINTINEEMPIKLIDDKSEIKVEDSHCEDKKKSVHKPIDIDTTILKPININNRKKALSLLPIIKKSWNNYIHTPFKKKIVSHILLLSLAMIVSLVAVFTASQLFYDDTLYTENKNVITIQSGNSIMAIDEILAQEANSMVLDSNIYFAPLLHTNIYMNPNNDNYFYNNYSDDNYKILTGLPTFSETVLMSNLPLIAGIGILNNDNDIIIDKITANTVITTPRNAGLTGINFLIGERIKIDEEIFNIVGIVDAGFNGAFIKKNVYDTCVEKYKLSDTSEHYIKVLSADKESLKLWAHSKGYVYTDSYEIIVNNFNTARAYTIVGTLICLVLALLIMLFICSYSIKANFINRINEIGTYRCIGVSKSKLIKEFVMDNLLVVSFSVLIGIILSAIGVWKLETYIRMKYDANLNNNALIYIGEGLVFYLAYTGLTIIKVSSLLRLTPAEIMSKYDI